MRNELLQWVEEQADIVNGITLDYDRGYIRAMSDIKEKINSIPVPDNLEWYLEGKDWTVLGDYLEEGSVVVDKSDALAALEQLSNHKDAEIEQLKYELAEIKRNKILEDNRTTKLIHDLKNEGEKLVEQIKKSWDFENLNNNPDGPITL